MNLQHLELCNSCYALEYIFYHIHIQKSKFIHPMALEVFIYTFALSALHSSSISTLEHGIIICREGSLGFKYRYRFSHIDIYISINILGQDITIS